MGAATVKPHRSFDPRRVGALECDAWVTYYRREWRAFLRAAVGLTRHTFGLPWPATLRGAWRFLRGRLPQGQAYTTLELHTHYVRAITADVGVMRAEGKVVHMGSRVATACATSGCSGSARDL